MMNVKKIWELCLLEIKINCNVETGILYVLFIIIITINYLAVVWKLTVIFKEPVYFCDLDFLQHLIKIL